VTAEGKGEKGRAAQEGGSSGVPDGEETPSWEKRPLLQHACREKQNRLEGTEGKVSFKEETLPLA